MHGVRSHALTENYLTTLSAFDTIQRGKDTVNELRTGKDCEVSDHGL